MRPSTAWKWPYFASPVTKVPLQSALQVIYSVCKCPITTQSWIITRITRDLPNEVYEDLLSSASALMPNEGSSIPDKMLLGFGFGFGDVFGDTKTSYYQF